MQLSATNFPEFISNESRKIALIIRYNDIKMQNALSFGINLSP